MVANPDWRWAEGHTVAAAANQAGLPAGDFVCEILAASDMAVGIVAFRPGERTEADVRAILRHPAHMAGSDGIFCGGFPHPRGWGAFARYLGYHTRQLGDYSWPEAVTHLATHAARRFRLTDRGLDPPRLRRRYRRARPGGGDRQVDLRRRPHPGRRRRPCAGQRHAGAGKRRTDRCNARPCSAAGMSMSGLSLRTHVPAPVAG